MRKLGTLILAIVISIQGSAQQDKSKLLTTDDALKAAAAKLDKEDWQGAVDAYTNILKENDKNPAALFFRAFAYEKLARYKFARYDYEQLLKVVPFNYEGMLSLALLNQKDNHYTDAYDQINNLIEMYPDSVSAYMARAGIERERNMIEPCIYDWGEVIKRDSTNYEHYITRAELLIDEKRYEAAKRDLDKAVDLGISAVSLNYLYRKLKIKK